MLLGFKRLSVVSGCKADKITVLQQQLSTTRRDKGQDTNFMSKVKRQRTLILGYLITLFQLLKFIGCRMQMG